jgi:aminopeptidase-like protein
LKAKLFSLPDQPNLIPYRTSYYERNWGFCLPHQQVENLKDGQYEVYIDADLQPGSLTYGELLIPGKSQEEIIFSAHICHPSLANDNLSGVCTLMFLAKWLMNQNHYFSYRFLFLPGTIGSITWLARNRDKLINVRGGLVATLLGDEGLFHYKKSRQGVSEIDQIVTYALRLSGQPHQILDFSPYGYDERQYCSPGFNLPFGCISRSTYGSFPEYHTSADNMSFITPKALEQSYQLLSQIVELLEINRTYKNLAPYGEPNLGSRGLYNTIGGSNDPASLRMAMLWILNLSDGKHHLLDIHHRSGISMEVLSEAALQLHEKELLTTTK